jgi:hypothetical protein
VIFRMSTYYQGDHHIAAIYPEAFRRRPRTLAQRRRERRP